MTTTLLAAASNDTDEEEEETCPVCYNPNPHPPAAGDAPTSVACEVCKHAVCGECDTMLTQTGHLQCPMCRAPRRPRALPFSMWSKCRLCSGLARLLQCPNSAPAPPQGTPGGSGRLGTLRGGGRLNGPTCSLGCSSQPPPESPMPPRYIADSTASDRAGRRAAKRGAELCGRRGDGARRPQILRGAR